MWQEKKKGWTDQFTITKPEATFSIEDTSQPVVPDEDILISGVFGEKKPLPKQDQNSSTFGVMGQAKHVLKVLTEDTGEINIVFGCKVLNKETNEQFRVEDAQKFDYYWLLFLSEVI